MVIEPVRQLCEDQLQPDRKGLVVLVVRWNPGEWHSDNQPRLQSDCRQTRQSGRWNWLYLRSRLLGVPGRYHAPLDSRQEPDLQLGSHVLLPEDQHDGYRHRYDLFVVPGSGWYCKLAVRQRGYGFVQPARSA